MVESERQLVLCVQVASYDIQLLPLLDEYPAGLFL